MYNKRRKTSNNKKEIIKNKITRCISKMVPVFENDTCEYFKKKEHTDFNNICKNCEHSWKFSDMKKKLSEDEGEAIHFIPEVAFVHTRCPKCGSPDFEITTGRGVSITSISGKE